MHKQHFLVMIGISCENASTLQLPQSQGLMMSQSVLFLSKGGGGSLPECRCDFATRCSTLSDTLIQLDRSIQFYI